MDNIVREFVKNNRPVREIMDMPYHYVLEILREETKPKQEKSLISAFGGGG